MTFSANTVNRYHNGKSFSPSIIPLRLLWSSPCDSGQIAASFDQAGFLAVLLEFRGGRKRNLASVKRCCFLSLEKEPFRQIANDRAGKCSSKPFFYGKRGAQAGDTRRDTIEKYREKGVMVKGMLNI